MTSDDQCDTCGKTECSARTRNPDESFEDFLERQELESRMCRIKRKVLVLSGKGGVGKSTVAVNLAVSLSMSGWRVGLLDVDIHGPSVPKMLHLEEARPESSNGALRPVSAGGLEVMSIGFLLSGAGQPVIWRGPLKMAVIKQFLKDVVWGDLDYLIIDCPPGTGDEPLSVAQLIGKADGAVIVTTPQDVALSDVRRSIGFCRQLKLPVLGIVENMSGYVCPKCGEVTDVFKRGGGERLAVEMKAPFLGRVPLETSVVESTDEGRPCVRYRTDTAGAKAFAKAAELLNDRLGTPLEE
jgi:Mrp family chromosome partitioning ATPase